MLRIQESTCTKKPKRMSAGQRVSKKYRRAYRKKLQRQEFKRLKAVLPRLSLKSDVDEVEVVEEAIKYIDSLHAQIMHRMMQGVLPDNLKMWALPKSAMTMR